MTTPDSPETDLEFLDPTSGDWFLQSLVETINGTEAELGITLQVGGLLVSGHLVSGHRWFEAFADQIAAGIADAEGREEVRAAYASYADVYRQDDPDVEAPLPQFIHLRDAHYFGADGSAIPSSQGVLWRGRVAQVAGFHLGRFEQQG
jgi:hypothetical protein